MYDDNGHSIYAMVVYVLWQDIQEYSKTRQHRKKEKSYLETWDLGQEERVKKHALQELGSLEFFQ